ncbi:MAG: cysteine desulfurase family protein [Terriglobia bacterium]
MIYLDHNATTPILPDVLEAMMPYLTTEWGNPSSAYKFGAKLKSVIETAREQVAELIGAHSLDIVFTSCATESNNAAIAAALKANPGKRHIVTSSVEHSSVLNYCLALRSGEFTSPLGLPLRSGEFTSPHDGEDLENGGVKPPLRQTTEGYRVTYLPVDRDGLLKLADLETAITVQTAVVSLMWANNETGVLFPVEQIAEICRSRGVLYHCDAVQAAGKAPIDVRKVPADYLSLTGHKFHAPKGIGALYVRRKAPFSPLIYGGHQERNRRGGTENVPLIVGMGKAAELARKHLPGYENKVRPMRDELERGILNSIPNTELNGHKTQRLANTTNITFHGIESEALLILLDKEGICASSGSACLADSDEPSHVIKAMKPEANQSRSMIRFSLGLETTCGQLATACGCARSLAETLRTALK